MGGMQPDDEHAMLCGAASHEERECGGGATDKESVGSQTLSPSMAL